MAISTNNLPKGPLLEEILRAYFIKAGFFVVRGVPYKFKDKELTDIDLWLYERPMGLSRRIQICDIKYKQRPKAIERIFWTKGLAESLNVHGAFVATTDKHPSLRLIANRLNMQLIDGDDINRIKSSKLLTFFDRITDEEFIKVLKNSDQQTRNKNLQSVHNDILSSLPNDFGETSLVLGIESFASLVKQAIASKLSPVIVIATGRLIYLIIAIICQSIDYINARTAFRTPEERQKHICEAIRLGVLSKQENQQALNIAIKLIEKYIPNGRNAASSVQEKFKKDLNDIPAEIIADQAMLLLNADQLFLTGRDFEKAAYQIDLPPYDQLNTPMKSILGALLDYSYINREEFANLWQANSLQEFNKQEHQIDSTNNAKNKTLFD